MYNMVAVQKKTTLYCSVISLADQARLCFHTRRAYVLYTPKHFYVNMFVFNEL